VSANAHGNLAVRGGAVLSSHQRDSAYRRVSDSPALRGVGPCLVSGKDCRII